LQPLPAASTADKTGPRTLLAPSRVNGRAGFQFRRSLGHTVPSLRHKFGGAIDLSECGVRFPLRTFELVPMAQTLTLECHPLLLWVAHLSAPSLISLLTTLMSQIGKWGQNNDIEMLIANPSA